MGLIFKFAHFFFSKKLKIKKKVDQSQDLLSEIEIAMKKIGVVDSSILCYPKINMKTKEMVIFIS
jgi:hypothetical protein